jgi:hypothetical protein
LICATGGKHHVHFVAQFSLEVIVYSKMNENYSMPIFFLKIHLKLGKNKRLIYTLPYIRIYNIFNYQTSMDCCCPPELIPPIATERKKPDKSFSSIFQGTY